jgi:hypothetical protein
MEVSDTQVALTLLNTGVEITSDSYRYFGAEYCVNFFAHYHSLLLPPIMTILLLVIPAPMMMILPLVSPAAIQLAHMIPLMFPPPFIAVTLKIPWLVLQVHSLLLINSSLLDQLHSTPSKCLLRNAAMIMMDVMLPLQSLCQMTTCLSLLKKESLCIILSTGGIVERN